MYTITFPIPIFSTNETQISLPIGLARDILTQLKYEPELRVICPKASSVQTISGFYNITLEDYPGLSFGFLPWNGNNRSWLLQFRAVKAMLIEEARRASVWHTCCSANLWDLTTMSYEVGRQYAKGIRVFTLDSDPAAMLENSGGWSVFKAKLVRSRLRQHAAEADAVIFVGTGVKQNYERFARRSVLTRAVWLQDGDLSNEKEVRHKFEQSSSEPVRIFLPSRLLPWKGIDDSIQALISLGEQIPSWQLDIMGEGPEKERLISLAQERAQQIRFLDPIPYGSPFFERLRSYHLVLAPTRALEETRIVYDAAASGCVLIHSQTATIEAALSQLKPRWSFQPGNVKSLASTIVSAFADRQRWTEAGLAGIAFMQGQTIDEMHRIRAEFLHSLPTKQ